MKKVRHCYTQNTVIHLDQSNGILLKWKLEILSVRNNSFLDFSTWYDGSFPDTIEYNYLQQEVR